MCAGRDTARLARSVGNRAPVERGRRRGLGVGDVFFVVGHNLFKQAPRLARALARVATGEALPGDLRPEATLGKPAS